MIVNQNAPNEYKYETDYCNIPREYLNPCIPEGRGSVKWQPFATIPEQYERLEQFIKDQNKIKKPILSEEQQAELNEKLVFKMFNDSTAKVGYFEGGYIKSKEGYVHKTDMNEGILTLNVNGGNM